MKINKKTLLVLVIALATFLRLFSISNHPSGLNADEAALGYNTYSLLKTGADEHGTSWPLVFRSFDDYKPPFYVYLSLPFIAIGGLSVFWVRLPSVIMGILAVYLIYLFTKELFPKNKNLPLLSAFLLAISPWHLHFSRGAWEVNVATTLFLTSLYFLLKAQKKPAFYLYSMISVVLALYTYHSIRVIAPLIFLSYAIIYRNNLFKQIKQKSSQRYLILSLIVGVILLVPLASQMLSSAGQSRFSGVSIFADTGPLSWVHEMRRTSPNPESIITKLKYNRYTAYLGSFVSNYLTHFSPSFLFIKGDEIARSKVPGFGQSHLVLLPFFYLGLILFFTKFKDSKYGLILSWLLIAPFAAALTFQSPHALRSQNMVIPLTIISALELDQVLTKLKEFKLIYPIFIVILLGSSYQWTHQYFVEYPKQYPYAWQYGFNELGNYLKTNQDSYDRVIITTEYDQPYILTAFFIQYDPKMFQQELVFSEKDNFGFATGIGFDRYQFHQITSQDFDTKNTLIVSANKWSIEELEPIEKIAYPGIEPSLYIYSTK